METKNSHNPLSAQELFNLIENKSEQNNNAQDLDEFEKEALEGFEEYSSPVNAKKINDEINLAISQKIGEQSSSSKNKIIWFSAAASVALIIAISVFYFNDSNSSSDSNIALNENTLKEINPSQPIAPIDELKKEITPDVSNAITENDKKTKPFKIYTEKEKITEGDIITSDIKVAASRNQSQEVSGINSEVDLDEQSVSKNLTDSMTNKAPIELAKNKKENVAGKTNESREEASSFAGGIAKDKTKTDNAKDAEYNRILSEDKSSISASAPSASNAEINADGITTNTRAYYAGEETAIKNYISSIAKKDNPDVVLKGKYKINVSVNTNGSIKLNSIINTTNDCKDCVKIITKILKDMKNWNPEIKNGKAIQSNKEFVLEF